MHLEGTRAIWIVQLVQVGAIECAGCRYKPGVAGAGVEKYVILSGRRAHREWNIVGNVPAVVRQVPLPGGLAFGKV